jgi:hypothetical protein
VHLPPLFPELRKGAIAEMKALDKAGCLRKLLRLYLPNTLFPSCQRKALLNVAGRW